MCKGIGDLGGKGEGENLEVDPVLVSVGANRWIDETTSGLSKMDPEDT